VASLAQVLRGDFGPHDAVDLPGVGPEGRQTQDTAGVAALNLSPRAGDLEGNLLLAQKTVTEAKKAYPDLRWVVLPELFVSGYTSLGTAHRYAEDAEKGPSAQRFAALARSLDIYIAYGFAERHPGTFGSTGISDSANLVGPDGLLFSYRKRHLVRDTGEHRVFVPGKDLPVVEAGGTRVALAICWDLSFPEVVREAATKGAGLILAPAGWRSPYAAQYGLTCASRALDNGVYLASANQIGDYPEANFDAPGGVYGPDGRCVSESFGNASIGKLDPEAPARWRGLYGSIMPPSNHAGRDARAESLDSYQEAVEETGEPA
jgi:predicted amidohydrolase